MSEQIGMDCGEFADVAAELALGVLTGRERAQAVAHLDECDSCREHVRQLSLTGEEMLGLLPTREPPAGFESRVMGRLGLTACAIDSHNAGGSSGSCHDASPWKRNGRAWRHQRSRDGDALAIMHPFETQPLVPMRYTDTKAESGKKHTYRVIAVNTVGSKSAPSAVAVAGNAR